MRVGLANGCFDLLHEGHLYFLEQASKHCDYLIVAVNSDRSVTRLKGTGRPVQDLPTRMYELQAQASPWVDAIIPFDGSVDALVMAIRPVVVIKGYDHGRETLLAMRVPGWKEGGNAMDIVTVVRIAHLPGYSTSLQLAMAKDKTSA